jgi:hypothetical protein
MASFPDSGTEEIDCMLLIFSAQYDCLSLKWSFKMLTSFCAGSHLEKMFCAQ